MDINNIGSMLVIPAKFPETDMTSEQHAHWMYKNSILLCLHWTEYPVTILQLALFLHKKYIGSVLVSNLTKYCSGSSVGCFPKSSLTFVMLKWSLISMISFHFPQEQSSSREHCCFLQPAFSSFLNHEHFHIFK